MKKTSVLKYLPNLILAEIPYAFFFFFLCHNCLKGEDFSYGEKTNTKYVIAHYVQKGGALLSRSDLEMQESAITCS